MIAAGALAPQVEAERAEREAAEDQEKQKRQRQAEVEQKAQETAARQAEAEQLRQVEAKVQDNPEAQRLILSTNLCMRKQDEREALEGIREEKRAAQLGGVRDLEILRAHQDAAVAAKNVQVKLHDALKTARLKPLGCNSKSVQALWSCLAEPSQDCEDSTIQALLRLSDRWSGTSDRYEWIQERSRSFARYAAGGDK